MPRAGVSRAHLSSQEDEDDGPEVVIQPSPARPRRSLKNKTLKVRHKLMEVDDHGLWICNEIFLSTFRSSWPLYLGCIQKSRKPGDNE